MRRRQWPWPRLNDDINPLGLPLWEFLQVGLTHLVLLVSREPPILLEIVIGAWEIVYGTIFILPWDTFSTAPAVYGWMRIAPQFVWGLALVSLGAAQILSLAYTRNNARIWAARVSAGFWAGLEAGYQVAAIHSVFMTHSAGLYASAFGAWVGGCGLIAIYIQYQIAPTSAKILAGRKVVIEPFP